MKHFFQNFTKYFPHHPLSADISFKFLSLILFEIWHLQNFISIFSKGRNFTRGDNSKKKKKIRICYFSRRNPYMKFQDDISFRNIIVAKFQGPKFWKRAITQKISYELFSIFRQIFYLSSPISCRKFQVSSYNTFRDTAFTKFHPLVCQRAVIYQGEISQGKPEICVGYFSMRNPYMKFQDDISNMNTHIHTDKPKPICPPLFQSWGHKNKKHC